MAESKRTSIQVSEDTKERLTKLGLKGDTYDDIITRLLNKHSRKSKS